MKQNFASAKDVVEEGLPVSDSDIMKIHNGFLVTIHCYLETARAVVILDLIVLYVPLAQFLRIVTRNVLVD